MQDPEHLILVGYEVGRELQGDDLVDVPEPETPVEKDLFDEPLRRRPAKRNPQKLSLDALCRVELGHQIVRELLGSSADEGRRVIDHEHLHAVSAETTRSQSMRSSRSRVR